MRCSSPRWRPLATDYEQVLTNEAGSNASALCCSGLTAPLQHFSTKAPASVCNIPHDGVAEPFVRRCTKDEANPVYTQ